MSGVKDQAVCIRSKIYSESSQILTFFSLEHGKLSAIAKGSRKPKSKFGGGVDVLTSGEIIFHPPHTDSTLATLSSYELSEPFSYLRTDLIALNCAQFMCELLDRFTEDYDPHDELYYQFMSLLNEFKGNDRPASVLLFYELTLLQEAGLAPVWDRCTSCSRKELDERRLYFSSSTNGMICRDCEPAIVEKRRVMPDVLRLLKKPSQAYDVAYKTVLDAQDLISYHLREQMGKQPAIMIFVNRLLSQKR